MSDIFSYLYGSSSSWLRFLWSRLYRFYQYFFGPTSRVTKRGPSDAQFSRLLQCTSSSLRRYLDERDADIDVLDGTCARALDVARRQNKIILTYLHVKDDPLAEVFLSDVLLNHIVQDFARDHCILFWASLCDSNVDGDNVLCIFAPEEDDDNLLYDCSTRTLIAFYASDAMILSDYRCAS